MAVTAHVKVAVRELVIQLAQVHVVEPVTDATDAMVHAQAVMVVMVVKEHVQVVMDAHPVMVAVAVVGAVDVHLVVERVKDVIHVPEVVQ